MKEDGILDKLVSDRYASWSEGLGQEIIDGKNIQLCTSFKGLRNFTISNACTTVYNLLIHYQKMIGNCCSVFFLCLVVVTTTVSSQDVGSKAADFLLVLDDSLSAAASEFQMMLAEGDMEVVQQIINIALSDGAVLEDFVEILIESFDEPSFLVEALSVALGNVYTSNVPKQPEMVDMVFDVVSNITVSESSTQLFYSIFTTMGPPSQQLFTAGISESIDSVGCGEIKPLLDAGFSEAENIGFVDLFVGTVRKFTTIAACLESS
eukprot:TRINITY_DN340_c0_g1_i1.p1 TRINITY_DN340_c0_g1~~TRINITY_DN340_c0_g1_i1.p1  ORF type:complete len:292 (-),score=44.37 TRINITY_DN340_c0_g1_i1:245-1036(-)